MSKGYCMRIENIRQCNSIVFTQSTTNLSHNLCDNYNRLKLTPLRKWHKLRPKDNPTIGILICQKANKEKVKWTLEGFNKPLGVATYVDNLMRMVEEHLDALQVVTESQF